MVSCLIVGTWHARMIWVPDASHRTSCTQAQEMPEDVTDQLLHHTIFHDDGIPDSSWCLWYAQIARCPYGMHDLHLMAHNTGMSSEQ